MDMEDVLLCAAAVLTEDERVAATVRRQYKWFVVDEFQDVSPIQVALLDLWLGGRDDVCVVGDPMQTIYSFAGASADFLTGFLRKHPGTQAIELVRNYRSTPQVVEVANKVAHARRGNATKVASVVLRAQRGSGPAVGFAGHANELDEAADVAERIERLREQGVAARDVAVLFRINAQSEAYEDALTARGIPYVVRGVERFFERSEVKQAVALLRGAARAGGGSDDLVADVVGVLSSMGWKEQAPPAQGPTQQVGVAAGDGDHGHRLRGRARCLHLAGLVEELERRARPSTLRWPTASRSATCSGEGPGVGGGVLRRHARGTVPIIYATTPRRSRRSVGSSTWGDPGAHDAARVVGSGSLTRRTWLSPSDPLPRRHPPG
jgi:DNA helicase-2/ATP-dependent DNA helicase PcrA